MTCITPEFNSIVNIIMVKHINNIMTLNTDEAGQRNISLQEQAF